MLQSIVPIEIPKPTDGVLLVMCMDCVDKTIHAYQFIQIVLKANNWWSLRRQVSDSNVIFESETAIEIDSKSEEDEASSVKELLDENDEDVDGMSTASEMQLNSDPLQSSTGTDLNDVKYSPKVANVEGSFRCCGRKCSLTFSSREELEQHGASKHGVHQRALKWADSFQYECTVCFTRFEHRKNLMTHLRRTVRDYECPVCAAVFDRPRNKIIHMKTLHPEYLQRMARKTYRVEDQATKICCGCGECFATMEELLEHSAKKHNEEHEQELDGFEEEWNVQCDICNKRFKNRANLQLHQRVKYLVKPFSCGECDKSFAYRSLLVTHQQIHASERNFVCEACGAAFKTKVGLVGHTSSHREKIFQCTKCDYRAAKLSRLKYHMQRHSDKMPFQCEICPKRFRIKSNLNSHMRSHSRNKPFECRYCERKYVYVSDRAKHERTHTGTLPYSCNGCGKAFVRPCLLKAHSKVCKITNNSEST